MYHYHSLHNSLKVTRALIVHWKKNKEYRVVRLYQDLVGDWIVSQYGVSLQSTNQQEYSQTILPTYTEARHFMLLINKQHRQQGYKVSRTSETQLDFQFD